MVTYQQLHDFDPKPLHELGRAWSKLSRRVAQRADDLDELQKRLSVCWEGKAYEKAAATVTARRRMIDATSAPLTSIDTELTSAADDLQRARGMLLDAIDDAARIPATVSKDGSAITYTGDDFHPKHRDAIQRRIDKVFDAIDDAIAVAEKADNAAAEALRKLVPGYDPNNPSKGRVTTFPPPGATPEQVKAWWDGLTPEQQQCLMYQDPDRIGGLDGVPIAARDQANRVRLQCDREKLETRRDQLEDRKARVQARLDEDPLMDYAEDRAEYNRINRELELIDRNLNGIDAIEKRLYDSPGKPRAYLLDFEPGTLEDRDGNGKPDDDGRAIIAIGNPDTADHVATYVPGTGADLDSLGGDIERADRMASDADKASGDDTAVILWLDYDAPDDVVKDAGYANYADDASGDLRRFQDGLRATHEGPASHNSVLGHSYGSTVIGHTASGEGGIAADDLIFVGSPGVGVNSADDLGIGTDHVWSTTAKHDAIKSVAGWHGGADPAGTEFGGRVFDSNPGDADDRNKTHSGYWDEDNIARENFAAIITGQPHMVTTPSPAPPPPPLSGP